MNFRRLSKWPEEKKGRTRRDRRCSLSSDFRGKNSRFAEVSRRRIVSGNYQKGIVNEKSVSSVSQNVLCFTEEHRIRLRTAIKTTVVVI